MGLDLRCVMQKVASQGLDTFVTVIDRLGCAAGNERDIRARAAVVNVLCNLRLRE